MPEYPDAIENHPANKGQHAHNRGNDGATADEVEPLQRTQKHGETAEKHCAEKNQRRYGSIVRVLLVHHEHNPERP